MENKSLRVRGIARFRLETRTRVALQLGSVLALTILAIWFRFYHLGEPSLWTDEAFTWWFTSLPRDGFVEIIRQHGVHPPAYFLVVKAVVGLLGDSEGQLRLLSALAGVALMPLAYLLGAEVAGFVGGLVAAWVAAFHPMLVWYSREARPYILPTALGFGLVLLFVVIRKRHDNSALTSPRVSDTRSQGRWVGVGAWLLTFLTITLGLLSHYFFFLLAGALTLLAAFEIRKNPGFFRYWTAVTLLAFLPLGAWLAWYYFQPAPSLGIGWIPRPLFNDLYLTIWNLLSGFGGKFSLSTTLFGGLVAILVVVGLWVGKGGLTRLAFLVGVLLPIVAVWMVSQRRPAHVDRYFIVLLPVIALLAATGGRWAWDRLIGFLPGWNVVLGGVVLFGFMALGPWTAWQVHTDGKYAQEDWRSLVAYYGINAAPGDSVWFSEPEASVPFGYYHWGELNAIEADNPPPCDTPVWWVIRQPYTATHAFTQSVTDPGRPWKPELPAGCALLDQWETPTGLFLWRVGLH